MNMTNEQIQALLLIATAAAVSPEWYPVGSYGDVVSIDDPKWSAVAEFVKTFNAKTVREILATWEADKALIAKAQADATQWKELVDAFCSDEVEWHKLTNSNNELISSLSTLICKQADRIAELEARTLTVKLPDGEEREDLVLSINEEIAHLNRCVERYRKEEMASTTQEMEQRLLVQQIALSVLTSAAGITLKVGGEDGAN